MSKYVILRLVSKKGNFYFRFKDLRGNSNSCHQYSRARIVPYHTNSSSQMDLWALISLVIDSPAFPVPCSTASCRHAPFPLSLLM